MESQTTAIQSTAWGSSMRRPPVHAGTPVGWMRANLFSGWVSTAITLGLVYLIVRGAISFVDWAFLNAVWTLPNGDPQACRDMQGTGACWAVITEKHRFILFGTYPFGEQWRPALVCLIFIGLYVVSAMRYFWRKELALVWAVALAAMGILMWGGVFGLSSVPQERWGGLPVTLILSTLGLASAFPIAILVALGRRSDMPAIKAMCVMYVELVRGVPLISVLFMASVIFPLFLPEGMNIDKLLRAQVAITLYAAAYLSEVVRGGLQSLPGGQYEAADALGLSYWKKTVFVILPQALQMQIPPLVNTFISFFKDTSLVLIIGIFDLLGTGKAAIVDPAWQNFDVEVYIAVGMVYFCFCFAMSRYSRRLEADLNRRPTSSTPHGKSSQ